MPQSGYATEPYVGDVKVYKDHTRIICIKNNKTLFHIIIDYNLYIGLCVCIYMYVYVCLKIMYIQKEPLGW